MALYWHLFWSLTDFWEKRAKNQKIFRRIGYCFLWFIWGFFSCPLILVDADFLIINYQTIMGVRGKKNNAKNKQTKKPQTTQKAKPENQVMFPLSKGLTLHMVLEPQLNACRLAVPRALIPLCIAHLRRLWLILLPCILEVIVMVKVPSSHCTSCQTNLQNIYMFSSAVIASFVYGQLSYSSGKVKMTMWMFN